MNEVQRRIERETGKALADLIRTRYWASFATVEVLAADLGCSREELLDLMRRHHWQLQPPPALRFQNRNIPTPPVSGTARTTDFLRNEKGDAAAFRTEVVLQPREEHLRITIECRHPSATPPKQSAGTSKEEAVPFNIGVWEAHFGKWENEWQWWTRQLRRASEAGKMDELVAGARAVGRRPSSVFEDDCIIVALTPVNIGEDTNFLDVTRFDPDPFQLARQLKRPEHPRIHQTGTYYLLAVNPRGVVQETYHDAWEDGFFWPSWRSGAEVKAEQSSDLWRAAITIPYRNLEPLMDKGAIWGVDLFRNKPAAGAQRAEYSRSCETVFFRYEGESIALKDWRVTFEDTRRHAWCAAVIPHVLETTERPAPEAVAAFLEPDLPESEWPAESDWERAECVSKFFDDRTAEPARAKTNARLLFDKKHLYVRFQCREEHTAQLQVVTPQEEEAAYPGHLRTNFLHRRGSFGLGWGDFVGVMLVPGLDRADCYHAGYYEFFVNSRGRLLERRRDAFGMESLRPEDEWRSGSRVSVEVRDESWIVRLAIPFESQYGVQSAGNVWRLNLQRMRAAKPADEWRELSAWAPSYGRPRDHGFTRNRNLACFGKLRLPGGDFATCKSHRLAAGTFSSPCENVTAEFHTRDRSRDPLTGVCFADEQHGWTVGGLGTVFHTMDGGVTWRKQVSGTDYALEKVTFVDRRHGWIAGGRLRDKAAATTGGMGIILGTADGGEHWEVQWEGKGSWLHDLCFLDKHVGWVCGENGAVLKTEDGGATWKHLPSTGTSEGLRGISFADQRHGWAVGENEVIIVTRDGGATWTTVRCPVMPRPLGTRKKFNAVHCVDSRHCWAVGTEGSVLRTTDGGESWELQDLGIDPQAAHVFDLTGVWFADRLNGWVVGEIGSVIFRTEDGGGTWEAVETETGHALLSVQSADARVGCATGELGTRLKTDDGGKSWQVQAAAPERPGWMYVTAHDHHMKGVAGQLAALATDHDVSCAFFTSAFDVCRSASWSIGAWQARAWWGFIGGRRRAPGRLHHHYQTKQGLEPMERRLAAAIRALKPEAIICEWPIMDEGYWAGEPAFTARAVVRAFDSAADPDRFPELRALGLSPWRTSRLYHVSTFFNDLYRVHPRNAALELEDKYSDTLGMSASEALFRCSCCWRGLLDRGSAHRAIRPLALHLKRQVKP